MNQNEAYTEAMLRSIELKPVEDPPAFLSEAKFSKTWLPMFLNYFAGTDEGVVSMWATNVAGNFYRPVHITATESTDSEILFTVPALLNNQTHVYDEQTTDQIATILATAQKHNNAFPGSGDKYILNNLVGSTIPNHASSSEEEAWKTIYRYYDIDAPFLNNKAVSAPKQAAQKTIESIEGYDDDF